MSGDGVTIPVPLHTRDERRLAERFVAEMPVHVDGREGTTQDFSSTGLSFRAHHAYALGSRVEVVIEYLLDGHQYPLRCEVEVVRCEPADGGFTIGARLAAQSRLTEVPVGSDDSVGSVRSHLRSVD